MPAMANDGEQLNPVAVTELRERLDDGPVLMLNLLDFKPGGGAERYGEYAQAVAPLLERAGARIVVAGAGSAALLGPSKWDAVAMVEYPTRRAFLDMVTRRSTWRSPTCAPRPSSAQSSTPRPGRRTRLKPCAQRRAACTHDAGRPRLRFRGGWQAHLRDAGRGGPRRARARSWCCREPVARDRRLALPGRDRLAAGRRRRDPLCVRAGEPRRRRRLQRQARPLRARRPVRVQLRRGEGGRGPGRPLPPGVCRRPQPRGRQGRREGRGAGVHRAGRRPGGR